MFVRIGVLRALNRCLIHPQKSSLATPEAGARPMSGGPRQLRTRQREPAPSPLIVRMLSIARPLRQAGKLLAMV